MEKWQKITLVIMAFLDFAVLAVGILVVLTPHTAEIAQIATAIPTATMTLTPQPTNTITPQPTATSVMPTLTPVAQTYTSLVPTSTPRYSPRLPQRDIDYANSVEKCIFWFDQIGKISKDAAQGWQNGNMRVPEFCRQVSAIALTTVNEAFSCMNNSQYPESQDLADSRQYFISGLTAAQMAWTLQGFSCNYGLPDQRAAQLMNDASDYFAKATSLMNKYTDRIPK